MAQLFYTFGALNAGKSIEILKVKHNYEEQGKKVILLTSAIDTRDGGGKVSSRIGLSSPAIALNPEDSVMKVVRAELLNGNISCILIDEAQFLTRLQVEDLTKVVDEYNIPVMAFGLKNDFKNNLFEGSEALLCYADKIAEMKTICWHCHKKAIMNLRLNDGKPVYTGEQIQIGGNESYIAVCRKHYHNPIKKTETIELHGYDETTLKVEKSFLEDVAKKEYEMDLNEFLSTYTFDDVENITNIILDELTKKKS